MPIDFDASDECVRRMNAANPDFTVTAAKVADAWRDGESVGFVIAWETESAGFGTITIAQEGGALKADVEGMGKRFVTEVFAKLIDTMETD